MTGTLRTALAASVIALLLPAAHAQRQSPSDMARTAFYALEAEPFEKKPILEAVALIEKARAMAPNDPWVLLAMSRATLEAGYGSGDRSRLASYAADAVKLGERHARKALEAAPLEPMAHVQVARFQIMTEDHRGAWETLNRAHALDPNGFYPWYYRGVVSLKMKDVKRASDAFDQAQARATLAYQKEWAVSRRKDIARQVGDKEAEERGYKQLIEMAPGKPHPYGNYGAFLKRQKRYDEAIEQYRKALAIRPYPLAEEQLKQTILLRDAKR